MSVDSHSLNEKNVEAYEAFLAEGLRRYEDILRHVRVVPAEAMWAYVHALIAGDNPMGPEAITLPRQELYIFRDFEGFPP